MRFDGAKFEPYVTVDVPARRDAIARQPSEYDEAAQQAVSYPRTEIFTLLMLLEVPLWMAGSWSDEKGGWRDSRSGVFFSFEEMRQLVAARISELGLSADLVHSWPHEVHSVAEEQAFRRLSFEQQMSRFKR